VLDLAAPNMVKFGIESKFSSLLTSTQKFKDAVVASMEEMQFLCEVTIGDKAKQIVLTSRL
jgi:carnitine O-acetyltransferase